MKNHERLSQTKTSAARFRDEQMPQLEEADEASVLLGHVARLLQEMGLDDIEK